MRKELAKYLSCYQGIDTTVFTEIDVPGYDAIENSLDSVLNEIFSPDPVSGFPKGDIQYYLSKDGNPQIKAWLETNLLMPRSVSSGSSVEGVTDDLIEEMSRKKNESFEEYSNRLLSIRDEAIVNSQTE